ncbi:aldo/keto reductase [Streptomyces sp. ET3-23]|uniref:aldo/keto reductase n=1 Tax=Streptomyces sp. ET3-23 TaxID=2885643 RepID=UPI001D11E463|nr:aldo/keto reductase [Streptomyces sp. ET3-23]MCC2280831.1 aldo/keto reductase [Streptomyces sp. ET3-23]
MPGLAHQSCGELMLHRPSGTHGLHLSAISLSIGSCAADPTAPTPLRTLLRHATDLGISHFDVTPSIRSPERTAAATALALPTLLPHRDALAFSARIGLGSQPSGLPGFGSRKRLLSGLDNLLLHTGLDYLDLLYAHRYDVGTPLEETITALASAVQQGKALYVGLSGYAPSMVRAALRHSRPLGVPLVSCQAGYSLLDRWIEDGLLELLQSQGVGCVAAAPLAHGALTPSTLPPLGEAPPLPALSRIAADRGQNLAQLALSWVLRHPRITSALITATRPHHLAEARTALDHLSFTPAELADLDACYPPPEQPSPPLPNHGPPPPTPDHTATR